MRRSLRVKSRDHDVTICPTLFRDQRSSLIKGPLHAELHTLRLTMSQYLPTYTPSRPAPSYSASPLPNEETLESTPRTPGQPPELGSIVRRWRSVTLILKDQDLSERQPSYGKNSIINGELGVSGEKMFSVSVKLEGRLTLSIADAGSSIITLISEKYILWKRSESSTLRCPNVIPFSIIFPATFEDGNRTRKLPPSYEALFYGSSALCVRCVYTLNITIIKRRPRFSLWKPTKTYRVQVNYRPRARPNRPVVRSPSIFSVLKNVPEEWYQIITAMRFRPSSGLDPIQCHFLIPSVQTFGLTDTIPVHIQLIGTLKSLRHFLPPSFGYTPSENRRWSRSRTARGVPTVRVSLIRQTSVTVCGKTSWRNFNLGDGKVWAKPPIVSPTGYVLDDDPDREVAADWEGEVRCRSDVKTSGFNIGTVTVQDYILFILTPPDERGCPLQQLQYTHPIKLVTDTWMEEGTHPQDI